MQDIESCKAEDIEAREACVRDAVIALVESSTLTLDFGQSAYRDLRAMGTAAAAETVKIIPAGGGYDQVRFLTSRDSDGTLSVSVVVFNVKVNDDVDGPFLSVEDGGSDTLSFEFHARSDGTIVESKVDVT